MYFHYEDHSLARRLEQVMTLRQAQDQMHVALHARHEELHGVHGGGGELSLHGRGQGLGAGGIYVRGQGPEARAWGQGV